MLTDGSAAPVGDEEIDSVTPRASATAEPPAAAGPAPLGLRAVRLFGEAGPGGPGGPGAPGAGEAALDFKLAAAVLRSGGGGGGSGSDEDEVSEVRARPGRRRAASWPGRGPEPARRVPLSGVSAPGLASPAHLALWIPVSRSSAASATAGAFRIHPLLSRRPGSASAPCPEPLGSWMGAGSCPGARTSLSGGLGSLVILPL